MDTNLQAIATLPFMGERLTVYVDQGSWSGIVLRNKKFFVSDSIAKDFSKLEAKFDEFCDKQLSQIIRSQIAKLRTKKIKTELQYGEGKQTFFKKVNISVNDFLKLVKYSQEIDFKIGKYDKEWGINAIDIKAKKFTLFFNRNLIKYDSGKHIEYVVAHELTHVFHRDHGPKFHSALEKLYIRKNSSESFFSSGIRNIFKKPNAQNRASKPSLNIKTILIIITIFIILFIIYWIVSWFKGLNLFSEPEPTNFF
jgi:flagellar basal body-associated protein FliL